MNASRATLAAALLLTAAACAHAASSVDLSVTGLITPSACTPTLSSGGVVELGKIAAGDILPGDITYLPRAAMDLAVNCEAATLFALAPQDNRPQMFTPWAFGFALMPSGKPMGGYWLDFVDSLADDVELTRLYSENNGQTWRVADPLDLIEPRKLTAFGEWIIGPANVLPIQNLNVSFLVSPFFYPGGTWLPANEEIPIDGSTTFELRYL